MKIKELENMMAGQRHINQAIRELVSRIVALHAESDKLEDPSKRIMIGKASPIYPIEITEPK